MNNSTLVTDSVSAATKLIQLTTKERDELLERVNASEQRPVNVRDIEAVIQARKIEEQET